MVTATGKTAQTIIALIVGIFTIIGGVYVAVQKGINVEIEDAVEEMAADEHSGLNREMVEIAEREAEEVQAVFQDDLDIFELEQKAHGESIARTEQKVVDLEKKIDDNKEDIIREIQRAGGGG